MAAAWSREAALSRLHHNRALQHALYVEPRLLALITLALEPPTPGYARDARYDALRLQSHHLVGPGAENPQLRAPIYAQALLLALDDLLPPVDGDPSAGPATES
jgi:hypothetical protein